jgi:alkane 1-monooxygenase
MIRFYVAPFFALCYVAVARNLGIAALVGALPLLAVCFAVFDVAFGTTPAVATGEACGQRAHVLPWLYIPLQIAVTLFGAIGAERANAGVATLISLALAIGTVAGIFGMLAAHEMIHSPRRVERALGLAMLASTTYMHFRLSHVRTHHRLAGTMADPATARRGESAYRFVLRSVIGQLRAAYDGERGRSFAANRVHRYAVISGALYLAIAIALGAKAVVFFALQNIVAIFILEIFNYVVHYGLQRRILPNGRPEPLGIVYSWNARNALPIGH